MLLLIPYSPQLPVNDPCPHSSDPEILLGREEMQALYVYGLACFAALQYNISDFTT